MPSSADGHSQTGAEQRWIAISVPACKSLRVLAFDMIGGVQAEQVAEWVSSIRSARIIAFALDYGDRDLGSLRKVEAGIKALDKPLCELAKRVYRETGKRLTMVLAANNPSSLVVG